MPVNVVLGAGGPTGFQCVKRLLEVTNMPVRAVVRNPAKYKELFEEAAGVIFAASGSGYWTAQAVDEQGVGNVVQAAKAAGTVVRVVLVSSMLTHPSNSLLSEQQKIQVRNFNVSHVQVGQPAVIIMEQGGSEAGRALQDDDGLMEISSRN
eukprot:gene7586-7791_t